MVNLLRVDRWPDLAAARERDRKAEFEQILDLHYRRTYRLIYRMVGNEGDAADLTQETFIRIYKALPKLRAEGASSAWVRRIATNVCVDYMRRRRKSPVLLATDAPVCDEGYTAEAQWQSAEAADPARVLEERERSRTVHRAINELPSPYRTVVLLHHIAGMRVDDVAETLDIPVGTVKSRLSRAREALRRSLTPTLAS